MIASVSVGCISRLAQNCQLRERLPVYRYPSGVLAGSAAKNRKDFDCWAAFYEYDRYFERLWNNPKKYLGRLKKFRGIISPDFSLYRNMPLVMQEWNTYRGRILAHWLSQNGIEVIPNVRFGDERTYDFCFDGIEKNKTVAVGTHGCLKSREDKLYFAVGMAELVKRLTPKNIIVYGTSPDYIFKPYRESGINIITFESEIAQSRKKVVP
jgi:hypothetical protein